MLDRFNNPQAPPPFPLETELGAFQGGVVGGGLGLSGGDKAKRQPGMNQAEE